MKKSVMIIGIVLALLLIGIVFLVVNNTSNVKPNLGTSINPTTEHPTNPGTPPFPETPTLNREIIIKSFVFSPSTLNIRVGDSVMWINQDATPHTVTSDSGNELYSSTLSQSNSYSHTFDNAGTYDYHCKIHPMMKGKVIVS